MEITIKIKDALIKEIIGGVVDDRLYHEYDKDILKKASVPKRAELVKAIITNKQVEAALQKEYSDYVEPDIVYDILYDTKFSEIEGLVNSCDNIRDQEQTERKDRAQAEAIKNAIRLVELAGFKLVKA